MTPAGVTVRAELDLLANYDQQPEEAADSDVDSNVKPHGEAAGAPYAADDDGAFSDEDADEDADDMANEPAADDTAEGVDQQLTDLLDGKNDDEDVLELVHPHWNVTKNKSQRLTLKAGTLKQLRGSNWYGDGLVTFFTMKTHQTCADDELLVIPHDWGRLLVREDVEEDHRLVVHLRERSLTAKRIVFAHFLANHWITVVFKKDENKVVLFDSLQPAGRFAIDAERPWWRLELEEDMNRAINCLTGVEASGRTFWYGPCLQQTDNHSCGPITCFNIMRIAGTSSSNDVLDHLHELPSGQDVKSIRFALMRDVLALDRSGTAAAAKAAAEAAAAAKTAKTSDDDSDDEDEFVFHDLVHEPEDPLDLKEDDTVQLWTVTTGRDLTLIRVQGAQTRWLLLTPEQLRLAPEAAQPRIDEARKAGNHFTVEHLDVKNTIQALMTMHNHPEASWHFKTECRQLLMQRVPVTVYLKQKNLHTVYQWLKENLDAEELPSLETSVLGIVYDLCTSKITPSYLMQAVASVRNWMENDAVVGPLMQFMDGIGSVAPPEQSRHGDIRCNPMATPVEECSYYETVTCPMRYTRAVVHLHGCAVPVHIRDFHGNLKRGVLASTEPHPDTKDSPAEVHPLLRPSSELGATAGQVQEVLFFVDLPAGFGSGVRPGRDGLAFVKFAPRLTGSRYGWILSSAIPHAVLERFFGDRMGEVGNIKAKARSKLTAKRADKNQLRRMLVQTSLMSYDMFYATDQYDWSFPTDEVLGRYGPQGALAAANADMRGYAMDLPLEIALLSHVASHDGCFGLVQAHLTRLNLPVFKMLRGMREAASAYAKLVCGGGARRRLGTKHGDLVTALDFITKVDKEHTKGAEIDRAATAAVGDFIQEHSADEETTLMDHMDLVATFVNQGLPNEDGFVEEQAEDEEESMEEDIEDDEDTEDEEEFVVLNVSNKRKRCLHDSDDESDDESDMAYVLRQKV